MSTRLSRTFKQIKPFGLEIKNPFLRNMMRVVVIVVAFAGVIGILAITCVVIGVLALMFGYLIAKSFNYGDSVIRLVGLVLCTMILVHLLLVRFGRNGFVTIEKGKQSLNVDWSISKRAFQKRIG